MVDIKKERLEQLNLANELNRLVSSYSDTTDLMEAMVHALKKFVSIDWVALARFSATTATLIPLCRTIDIGKWNEPVTLKNTPLALLREKKHALLESDLKKSKLQNNDIYRGLQAQGIRTVVYMPLFSQREPIGSLIVGSKQVNAYHDRDLRLIKYTTTQINTILERHESQEISKRDRETLEW